MLIPEGSRIVLIFDGCELGGAERQGLLLASFLKKEHHADVHVWGLGAQGEGRVTELCAEYGIPWRGVSFDWSNNRMDRLLELVRFAIRLRRQRAAILLPYTLRPNVVCGLSWRLSGARKCIWNQRDEGLGLNNGFWHRMSVRLTKQFVSNSAGGQAALRRLYGLAGSEVEVIHNGISLPSPVFSRQAWRERLGITGKSFIVTMAANLSANKDHATLLRAWRNLSSALGETAMPAPLLLLAGRFDPQAQEIKRIAADLDLENNMRFLGKVDDIAGLFAASDLCVHSSVSEGLPNGILEAMAAGLPVVATDIPGVREAVGPDNHKYLAEAGNADDLMGKIRVFWDSPRLCQEVGRRNEQRVLRSFDPARMCAEMSKCIGIV